MKKYFHILVLVIMTVHSLNGAGIDAQRVVQLPVKNDPTISFRIVFNAGSQYDPKGKEGLAYLTAQMIGDGATKNNSYKTILKKLFPLAASFSVSLSREIAVYQGRIHKDNLDCYYALFTDQILNPAFNEDDFQRIKQNVLNYLKTTLKYSSDEELGKAVLYQNIYQGTPYGNLDQGTISGVESITIDDIKSFYTKHYNRNNFILGIGGGYSESLLTNLWSDLSGLPNGEKTTAPPINAPELKGYNVVIVEKNASATAISMGYPINLVRGSKEWYALSIANSWLGEHRNSSSHLYQVIREKRGLNYGDYSYIEHYPNGGRLQKPPVNVPRRHHIFEIWIRPVPNNTTHFTLRAALREHKKLIDKGMTQEEFETTRNFLKKYVLHYAPTTSMRLGYALDDRFYGLSGSHLEMYRKNLETVTLQDVNAAIKKYLQTDNMLIAIITSGAQQLAENLASNTASPITYSSPKDETILSEDKEIEVFPLPIKKEKIKILTLEELFK